MPLELALGELLDGEVLGCLDHKRTAIRINGLNILAESRIELNPGDRIVVEVVKLEPNVVFSLVLRKNNNNETIEVVV